MGAKTTMLVVADTSAKAVFASYPTLDREASVRLLGDYFPGQRFESMADGCLGHTYPDDAEVYIGRFPGVTVIAAREFGIDYPSRLDAHFLQTAGAQTVCLHTMHSVVDFFAYGVWRSGKLVRSLSLAPDYGVMEETGERPEFERPYWAGEYPADDPEDAKDPEYEPYPFPFHPLDLGEAALREFFGYQLEGFVDPSLTEPYKIPLLQFKRSPA
jgi:hypothetical protein